MKHHLLIQSKSIWLNQKMCCFDWIIEKESIKQLLINVTRSIESISECWLGCRIDMIGLLSVVVRGSLIWWSKQMSSDTKSTLSFSSEFPGISSYLVFQICWFKTRLNLLKPKTRWDRFSLSHSTADVLPAPAKWKVKWKSACIKNSSRAMWYWTKNSIFSVSA